MRRITTCLALCGLLLAPSLARGAIIVNEVVYDDSGTDNIEFVELYNSGPGAVDISGWTLAARDPTTVNASATVPAATSLAAGAYYVFGNAGVLNQNQLIPAGATGFLENDIESVEIRDAGGTLVDAIIYESNKGIVGNLLGSGLPVETGPGWFGNNGTTPDLPGLNTTISVGRFVNGRDTNNNGRDFGMRPSTPGTSNNTGVMTHYLPPNPIGSTVGNDVPGLVGTFVNARYIDPTVASLNNPNAIPPAPYTGNRAIVAWDPAGGGNAVTSQQVFDTTQMGFRVRAYFDTSDQPQNGTAAAPTLGTELSIYSVGGGDMLTNLTDLGGNMGIGASTLPASDTANGYTGIAWVYERTANHTPLGGAPIAATQTLYLVDANDGGDSDLGGNTPLDWTILQAIDISGMASNWYDLSIKVDALGNGIATFNGTPYIFTTSAGLHSGAFNVGYRENLTIAGDSTPDAFMRPPTFTLVPEPASIVLMYACVAALVFSRRR